MTKSFFSFVLGMLFLVSCNSNTDAMREFECCFEQEMNYANGDVSLAATLLTPKGDGPFPALVLLQGAGDSGRSNVWSGYVARSMVEKGFAVLWTDKRGSDKSGGDWKTSTFDDLAEDALAGIEAIRDLPAVDGNKIGLIGLSQGGHVAPHAALQGDVKFVISLSAASLPIKDTTTHELEQTYKNLGLSEEDIVFLQEMTHASYHYIETGQGWDDYLKIRSEIHARFGDPAVASWPDSQDNWYWTFWRGIVDTDPFLQWKEIIEEKGIPVFVAYGELDEFNNVPVFDSVARFKEGINSGNLTVRVYENTGHGLWTADDPDFVMQKDMKNLQLVQPFLDDLDVWIEENISR